MPHPKDIHAPLFTSADVCRAVPIAPALFKSWVSRGDVPIIGMREHDKAPASKGSPALLSLRRVVQIAIAMILVNLKVYAKEAAEIALRFTDMGMACHHFPSGDTFLVVNGGSDGGSVTYAVVNSIADLPLARPGTVEAAIIINVTRLEERIRIALGMDAEVNRIEGEG